jgi:hypothetical protein
MASFFNAKRLLANWRAFEWLLLNAPSALKSSKLNRLTDFIRRFHLSNPFRKAFTTKLPRKIINARIPNAKNQLRFSGMRHWNILAEYSRVLQLGVKSLKSKLHYRVNAENL